MPVNIDTVYQRVLAIANKEQRGYITPQEFNLFANQVQIDIFEQYFYDLNQFRRVQGSFESSTDMISILEDKISIFEEFDDNVAMSNYTSSGGGVILPNDLYRITRIDVANVNDELRLAERLNTNDFNDVRSLGPLTSPFTDRPVYNVRQNILRIDNGGIGFVDPTAGGCFIHYVRRPIAVNWGYVVLNNKALYNANTSVNFELHASEEKELVTKILSLAGIAIEDMALYQVAEAEDVKDINQEKM
jgi:hypothetical protein